MPFLRLRHIWQHKETCSERVQGEAVAPVTTAGCRSDGMRRLAQSLHTRILTAQHDTRASFLPSMDPTAFPARPLADSETNKLPGGHGQLRCGVVLREESIQPTARLYLPVVSWHLLLILAGRLSQPPEPITITCCLPILPAARLTLQHAQSHVLLACRQSSNVNSVVCCVD